MARVLLRAVMLFASLACDISRPVPVFVDAGSCPVVAQTIETPVLADVRCSSQFCSAAISQEGCSVRVATSCTDLLEGTIEGDLIRFSGDDSCLGSSREGEPFLNIECTTNDACNIDLFHTGATGDYEVREVVIVDREFRFEAGSDVRPLDGFDPFTGYLSGMAVLEDRIAVAAFEEFQPFTCRSKPTRIALVDRASLDIENASGPECLESLAAVGGDRFIGLHGGPMLSWFDQRGQVLHTVRLSSDETLQPIDLVADVDRMIAHALVGDGEKAQIFAIELVTMAVTSTSVLLTGHRRSIAYGASGDVLLADKVCGRVERFDPVSLEERTAIQLFGDLRMLSNDAGRISTIGSSMLVSATGEGAGLWLIEGTTILSTAAFFERAAVPWASASDGDRIVVGVTGAAPEFTALVAVFDRDREAFAPGSTEIGRGVVRSIAADRDGDLWALLPWSGRLVRLHR